VAEKRNDRLESGNSSGEKKTLGAPSREGKPKLAAEKRKKKKKRFSSPCKESVLSLL